VHFTFFTVVKNKSKEKHSVRDNSALAVGMQHRREMVTQKAFDVLQFYSRT
jgi:hypothetical protein